MEMCGMIWKESNEGKIFKNIPKALQVMFFHYLMDNDS
jgi:hypothetical protein